MSSPRKKAAYIYIDADNQRHTLARPLLAALRARGLTPRAARLFGNNVAWSLSQWHATLLQDPALTRSAQAEVVPRTPQAADCALMLALGGSLHAHLAARETVVIVSRDTALVACAERVAASGIPCLVAHHATGTPARLPHARAEVLAIAPDEGAKDVTTRVQALMRALRGDIPRDQAGQLLRAAGLDRKAREALYKSMGPLAGAA